VALAIRNQTRAATLDIRRACCGHGEQRAVRERAALVDRGCFASGYGTPWRIHDSGGNAPRIRLVSTPEMGESVERRLGRRRLLGAAGRSRPSELAAIFNDGMFAGTLAAAAEALDADDFLPFETSVDVGGESGRVTCGRRSFCIWTCCSTPAQAPVRVCDLSSWGNIGRLAAVADQRRSRAASAGRCGYDHVDACRPPGRKPSGGNQKAPYAGAMRDRPRHRIGLQIGLFLARKRRL
jgi:hypothetical protein